MTRKMMINIARAKQGRAFGVASLLVQRSFDVASLLVLRCSDVALKLLQVCIGNVSVMSRLSLGDVSVQNHTSKHNVSMMFRNIMLMVMMLTFGINVSWGQTDFSGTYYIAFYCVDTGAAATYNAESPTNNYYWCPVECTSSWKGWFQFYPSDDTATDIKADTYQTTDSEMDFLTTYKCRGTANYDSNKAVWTIIKHETLADCYYIQHRKSLKYLTFNGYMNGTTKNGQNRLRLHLQADIASNNMSLFTIRKTGNYFVICPYSKDNTYYINVSGNSNGNATGNENQLYGGTGKTDGPSGLANIGGTLGIYTVATDKNGKWYLEDYIKRPTISYDSNNKVVITPAQTGATIKYTLDGSTPSADHGDTYSIETPLEPALGTTIKAVAIIGSGESQSVSNIATFTYIKLADKYVIQSKDCEFYNLIPNLEISGTDYKNLTTLNVPCKTMVWNFENAADNDGQYYYIKNLQGGYMYYTATSNNSKYVYFSADKDTNDDGYKFSISAHASGGFNIIPKGQATSINKTSIALDAVKLAGAVGEAKSRWALIPYSETTKRTCLPQWKDVPFDESDGGHTYYYRIKSVKYPAKPIILDDDGSIKSEAVPTPTTSYDTRKSVWVIKNVGTDTDGLLDYYTFQNAYTGELLYYNGKGRGIKDTPPVLQIGKPDGANDSWSHFVVVQTVSGYNIIPREIVDKTKAISRVGDSDYPDGKAFNCINRAGGDDSPGTWYDNDNNSRWTFEQKTDVKCMNPTFAENTDENFTISCVTNAAVIHYTTNGEDPTASSGVYSAPIESASEKICIKAIAIVGDGADEYSKSEIVTLMNKPDITLKEGTDVVDDNTYIYDGTAKVPSVTVSIGNVVAPTDTYTTGYANNTDAGTETNIPTVTITDVDNDLWIINTAPRTFVINPRNVTLTWTNTELEYTGTEQKPTLTVGNIVEGETLTITVSINEADGGINRGTYTATATIEENSNYVLPTDVPLTTSYTINQKILGDGTDPASDISIDITYNGEAYIVTVKQGGSTILTEGESNDYTETGSVTTNGKYYIVTVTGSDNNYGGSFTAKYALMKFDHQAASGEFSGTFVSDAGNGETEGDGDFAVPDGMKAYIITDIRVALDQVVAVEVGYIPEGVPVLLLYDDNASANPASGFFVKAKSDGTATVNTNNNLLKVTTAATSFSTGKIYLLYKGEFVLNKAGSLAAGKIYLDNTTGGVHAPRLAIAWDESTVVEEVRGKMEDGRNDKWYTLDGRRLSGKPTKKGLYINYGRKIVIK